MTAHVSPIAPLQRQLSVKPPMQHPAMDSKKHYKQELKYWQTQLLHTQQAYYHQGRRAIIVFEGWDASGKGGAIRRMTENSTLEALPLPHCRPRPSRARAPLPLPLSNQATRAWHYDHFRPLLLWSRIG